MFHIVLVEPEIPHNTGAAGRLALATGSTLHLIEPLGFSLDDKQVKRTGLDYWHDVKLRTWPNLDTLRQQAEPTANFWFMTTKAEASPWNVSFKSGDYLVFGRETSGLPMKLIEQEASQTLRIPMAPEGTRSLNLSTAVAIVLYEAVRQQSPDWSPQAGS